MTCRKGAQGGHFTPDSSVAGKSLKRNKSASNSGPKVNNKSDTGWPGPSLWGGSMSPSLGLQSGKGSTCAYRTHRSLNDVEFCSQAYSRAHGTRRLLWRNRSSIPHHRQRCRQGQPFALAGLASLFRAVLKWDLNARRYNSCSVRNKPCFFFHNTKKRNNIAEGHIVPGRFLTAALPRYSPCPQWGYCSLWF